MTTASSNAEGTAPDTGRARAWSRAEGGRAARQVGYAFAVVLNLGLLYVVRNLANWDLLPFLTDDFEAVVDVISLSMLVSAAANAAYIAIDARWFRALGELVSLSVSLVAIRRTRQVFPFELSDDWEQLVRVALIVAIVATVIGLVAAAVRLLTEAGRLVSGDS